MITLIKNKVQEEIVFTIAVLLAIVSSFFVQPSFSSIDFKVIFSLFNLMAISLAFEKYLLLDSIAVFILSKAKTERSIGFTMILTTAILGMLITNDVALITIVPITIVIAKKSSFDPLKIIVLETLAANIGSSLTPFGNPQNLYLYEHYKIDTFYFFSIIAPFVFIGIVILLVINKKNNNKKILIEIDRIKLKSHKKILLYCVLFLLVLLSVLRIFDYRVVTIIVCFVIIIFDIGLIAKIDYFLLGTFIGFFIFIDNIVRLEIVQVMAREILNSKIMVFISSAFFSQIISNVPSAILISGFTDHYESLLLGVSVGGIGTLIASLANLISYKIYCKTYNKKKYIKYFYFLNMLLFILFLILSLLYLSVIK